MRRHFNPEPVYRALGRFVWHTKDGGDDVFNSLHGGDGAGGWNGDDMECDGGVVNSDDYNSCLVPGCY